MIEPPIWERVSADWPALLDGARALVQSERWAPYEADWERPEPLLAEREGNTPVTVGYDDAPDNVGGTVRYGFAADGSLVLADRFEPTNSAAWVEVDGTRVLIKAAAGGEGWAPNLMTVTVPRFEGDRLVGVDARWLGSETIDIEERYGYDEDGRVATITVREQREEGLDEIDYEATYDPDGEVAMVRSVARLAGEPEQTYVDYRRSSRDAARSAARLVEHELPPRVVAWARRAARAAPPAALALVYSREFPGLPPALAIATEADRAELAAAPREPRLPAAVWNPGDWSQFDAQPDEFAADTDFLGACRMLLSHWDGADEPMRRLLVKCAKAVAKELPDVVVFAVDDEQEDLEQNLRASTTAAERRRMEAA